ncbi:glycosyltransferase [Psychrobacter faecalis]|uniref:glycosyltransferase n=1 Tax=Psychrobacter faecalis TaxID=180588 RepID=UPI003FD4BF8C
MKVCSVGYGYFPHKLEYQANSCSKLGLNYSYLVLDVGKLENKNNNKQKDFEVVQVPQSPFFRFLHYLIFIVKNKIDLIEVYDTGLLTFFYVFSAIILNKKVVVFLIGMELLPLERGEVKSSLKRKIKRFGLFLSLKLSSRIIYKELHMQSALKNYNLLNKSFHLHNCVPVVTKLTVSKDIDIIYINTIRKMRHPVLFLKAIKILKDSGVDFNCVMMGFHSIDCFSNVPDIEAEKEALDYIKENNLSDCVEVLPFSNDSIRYIKRSKIFVLPSDVIYANYSLLEAMSYSCVPVVTSGDGADKVITNGVDGYICAFSEYDIFEKISLLINEQDLIAELSKKAKNKIQKKFSIDAWASKLVKVYREL